MGTCCSASPMSEKFESIDTMRLEQWYLGNDYFDQITFNRNIQQDENHCFQRVLRQVWKDKAMQTSLPPRNAKPKYSSEIREEFHYLIQK